MSVAKAIDVLVSVAKVIVASHYTPPNDCSNSISLRVLREPVKKRRCCCGGPNERENEVYVNKNVA